MRGISIGYIPRNVGSIWPEPDQPPIPSLPADVSAFSSFFRPIFPLLGDYYWFATGYSTTPFNSLIFEEGGEERFDAAVVECGLAENRANLLYRPGSLPELAPYLANDWVDLIALGGSEPRAIEVSHRLAQAAYLYGPSAAVEYDRLVGEVSDLAFYCVDGFIWELYARKQETLALVEAPLRAFNGITLGRCELAERAARYWNAP